MTSSRPIVVKVESLDAEGRGVVSIGEKSFAILGTIPGEKIRIQVSAATGTPRLLDIVEPSPDRVSPPCPHFPECGGCQIQHLSVPRQLVEKQGWLARVLGSSVAAALRPILASPQALR
ncbi:MAG: hypothetical protein ACREP8_10255, partial [Candidatus Binatia bacterium]